MFSVDKKNKKKLEPGSRLPVGLCVCEQEQIHSQYQATSCVKGPVFAGATKNAPRSQTRDLLFSSISTRVHRQQRQQGAIVYYTQVTKYMQWHISISDKHEPSKSNPYRPCCSHFSKAFSVIFQTVKHTSYVQLQAYIYIYIYIPEERCNCPDAVFIQREL